MNKNASDRIFLSLGSNQGDRWAHLQRSIFRIEAEIGPVLQCSRVYENPAQGFEGDSFYNCCIEVSSSLSPLDVLHRLQQIEHSGGRERTGQGYSSRTIDLDLLLYGQQSISEAELTVPHPRMAERGFVLHPLLDLGIGHLQHPKSGKSLQQLAADCPDKQPLTPLKKMLLCSVTEAFEHLDYLAIEGNIGVGKTSLATRLSSDYNARLLLERFEENAFLPAFYKDPQRYAFPLEMSFLADRFQQLQEQLPQNSLFSERVFSDYHLSKSLLFAQVTLEVDELRLYKKLYELMQLSLPQPQLYLFLQQNPERLLANIKQRGREYEQNIQADYLQRVEEGYKLFLQQYDYPKLVIDVSELDFVQNTEDYQLIVHEVAFFLSKNQYR